MTIIYTCATCSKKFDDRYNYKKHLGRKTPCKAKNFQCSYCNKTFTTQVLLNNHMHDSCKIKKLVDKDKKIQDIRKKIKEAKKEVKKQDKKIAKLKAHKNSEKIKNNSISHSYNTTNNTTNNNTINYNNNIEIKLLVYGGDKENISNVIEKDLKKIINKVFNPRQS